MVSNTMPLTELTATAIKLLCREIGVVNTARFINQFSTGYGNYTEERDQLLGERTVDDIVAEIKMKRRTRPSKPVATSSISPQGHPDQ